MKGFGKSEGMEMGDEAAKPGNKKRKPNKSPDPASREVDLFAKRQLSVSVSCMQGYTNVAEKKLNGIMDLNEGCYSLSFAGYCFLSEEFMKLHPMGMQSTYIRLVF